MPSGADRVDAASADRPGAEAPAAGCGHGGWATTRFVLADAPMEPARFGLHDGVRDALASDDVVVFRSDTAPTVAAGDPVAPAGLYGSPHAEADLLHWELFSVGDQSLYAQLRAALREQHLAEMPEGETAPVLVEFADAVDPNDDGKLTDTEAITDILAEPAVCTPHAQPDTASSVIPNLLADGTLEREEVSRFYAGHPGAERLRAFACEFVGEWRTVPEIYDWVSAESLFGSASEMMWWSVVAEALTTEGSAADGIRLPEDGRAWYYHPVRLLSLVAEPTEVPEAGSSGRSRGRNASCRDIRPRTRRGWSTTRSRRQRTEPPSTGW